MYSMTTLRAETPVPHLETLDSLRRLDPIRRAKPRPRRIDRRGDPTLRRFFVCGDGERMAPPARDTLVSIRQEYADESAEEARAWLEEREADGRHVADVFS